MIISRQLNLKISRDMFGNTEYYEICDEVTVLCKNNSVYIGEIIDIGRTHLYIRGDDNKTITINYSDIKNIADTNWLAGEDIREI